MTLQYIKRSIDNGLTLASEWAGTQVNVGFLKLTVVDYSDNVFTLKSADQAYTFSPYHGLQRG